MALAADIVERIKKEGEIFPLWEGALGIFNPGVAMQVDIENFKGVAAPAGLAGFFWRTQKPGVTWEAVRAVLLERVKALNTPGALEALYGDMRSEIRSRSGCETDLAWFAIMVSAQPLIDRVITGLPPAERAAIAADLEMRIRRALESGPARESNFALLRRRALEFRVGGIVRRVLRERTRGIRPGENDMAAGALELREALGPGGAAYALTTVLHAISGAPGPVAACMLCELINRRDWRRKLRLELDALETGALCSAPTQAAPVTHRFIKEVLRKWSFPPVVRRFANRDISVGDYRLSKGENYYLSMCALHHSDAYWTDADRFDPDRWLESAADIRPGAYVPFGWRARSCIGATLGVSQLIIFAHLMLTQFDIRLAGDCAPEIELSAVAIPKNFNGAVLQR